MSDTPIHDSLDALHQSARQLGYVEGRKSMQDDVLTILRNASKHVPPAFAEAIKKIEQLRLTK